MNETDIFRALANETRLNILKWLREPGKNFPPQGIHIPEGDSFENSVCVGSICDLAGLSQSVISKYLGMMERRAPGIRPLRQMDLLPPERRKYQEICPVCRQRSVAGRVFPRPLCV